MCFFFFLQALEQTVPGSVEKKIKLSVEKHFFFTLTAWQYVLENKWQIFVRFVAASNDRKLHI